MTTALTTAAKRDLVSAALGNNVLPCFGPRTQLTKAGLVETVAVAGNYLRLTAAGYAEAEAIILRAKSGTYPSSATVLRIRAEAVAAGVEVPHLTATVARLAEALKAGPRGQSARTAAYKAALTAKATR